MAGTFILILLAALIIFFALNPHLLNLIRCGKPKPFKYNCFPYVKINSKAKYGIPKAKEYNTAKLTDNDTKILTEYNTLAFLVLKDNQLLYETYFNIQPGTRVNSFSASKTIVSLLIGIAIDKGCIKSINQKAGDFLPGLENTGITIKHLLTMTSGIHWNENFSNPFSHVIKAFYTNNLTPLLQNLKTQSPPGQVWHYQCINTLLLGRIIEKACQTKLYNFASEYLWTPLGAEQHALWTTDKNNIVKSFCCFYATATGYARLGLLIQNNGTCCGNTIVPADYIKQMTASYNLRNRKNNPVPYGLHIWKTKHNGLDITYLRGMYGQYVLIIPQLNTTIVRLGNKRTPEINYVPQELPSLLDLGLGIIT